uniref:Uncharacterized protein n=1 Tax=Knipowitschia caucasica TaxID=637954 RepID=A0AAV2K4J3_KNICA
MGPGSAGFQSRGPLSAAPPLQIHIAAVDFTQLPFPARLSRLVAAASPGTVYARVAAEGALFPGQTSPDARVHLRSFRRFHQISPGDYPQCISRHADHARALLVEAEERREPIGLEP